MPIASKPLFPFLWRIFLRLGSTSSCCVKVFMLSIDNDLMTIHNVDYFNFLGAQWLLKVAKLPPGSTNQWATFAASLNIPPPSTPNSKVTKSFRYTLVFCSRLCVSKVALFIGGAFCHLLSAKNYLKSTPIKRSQLPNSSAKSPNRGQERLPPQPVPVRPRVQMK